MSPAYRRNLEVASRNGEAGPRPKGFSDGQIYSLPRRAPLMLLTTKTKMIQRFYPSVVSSLGWRKPVDVGAADPLRAPHHPEETRVYMIGICCP